MKIKVLKFGGTSVGSVEAIKRSANIICDWSKKSKVIVVLSAMSGETDRLINLTKSFSKSPNPVDFDNAISTGENLSCALMSIYLNNQKTKSKSLHSWQIPIMTSSEHMKSRILSINKKFLLNELENLDVLVVPGFQGINERREITTLGRGGSDTSAVAVDYDAVRVRRRQRRIVRIDEFIEVVGVNVVGVGGSCVAICLG